MTSKQILEALQMQPLSEEEKQKRHILGRLYGPIATSKEDTRNGRRYNRELWEKALADDVFKEKLDTKSLFLELGHPTDREEIDMTKVCACIPEMPKIVDGDLYAYVDILDTPNGQILKTLCDYGFVPGISSRGSGDVLPNDEVDPETFYLETFDIVGIPAVKKARLTTVCESFDNKNKKLKKALTESYKNANAQEQKIMKEALNNLHINLTEEVESDDIPWVDETLVEAEDIDTTEDDTIEIDLDDTEETEVKDIEDTEDTSDEAEEVEDTEEASEEKEDTEDNDSILTVGKMIDNFKDYDSDLVVIFNPIKINDKEYPVEFFDCDDTVKDGELTITINPVVEDADSSETEPVEKPEKDAEEVSDAETDAALEGLKEALLEKELLSQQVKSLKNKQAVRDTEVKKIQEELDKYKSAFARTSEIASTAKTLTAQNKQLKEQLATKDTEINTLKQAHSENLNENIEVAQVQIKSLKEKLKAKSDELAEMEEKLAEQATSYKKQLQEKVNIAKTYKSRYDEILKEYVSYRASMLGIQPVEITSKLNESYSISDVNKICDTILTEGIVVNRLPYGVNSKSRVAINESKTVKPKVTSSENGYEIDDSLLELAGLK